MSNRTTPRVNLLHAHGSPTQYRYCLQGCRCVSCRGAQHEHYQKNRETLRANTDAFRAQHPGYMKKYRDTWKLRYPEKRQAHKAVANAILHGRMVRQPCEVCGASRAEAHHDDYARPLDVRWLCMPHHRDLHAEKR